MTSYFDNQYGGEDLDDNFKGGEEEDDDKSVSDKSSVNEEEEEDELAVPVGEEEEEEEEEELDDDDEEEEEGEGQAGGAEDDDLEEGEVAEVKTSTKTKKISAKATYQTPVYNEDDDIEDDGEIYLQKFDQAINENLNIIYLRNKRILSINELQINITILKNVELLICFLL